MPQQEEDAQEDEDELSNFVEEEEVVHNFERGGKYRVEGYCTEALVGWGLCVILNDLDHCTWSM